MKISVITPCLNCMKTITRTITSVIQQGEYLYEYIIIDGGSTDGTENIIRAFASSSNGKIKYVSEKDNGIYYAINKGIRMASGDIIGIINADDWYEDNALKTITENYENEPFCIIYGMLKIWQDDKLRDIIFHSHDFLFDTMIPHPSCFITKQAYKKYGYYNENYKSSSDYDLMLRFAREPQILFKPVFCCISNFSAGGISSRQIGARETYMIKYKNGLIKKRHFIVYMLKSYIKELISRL